MAKHYSTMHPGLTPSLSFEILDTETSTVKRKIIEAYYINNLKPELNDKEEFTVLERFLVR